jgi:hypothetical protein
MQTGNNGGGLTDGSPTGVECVRISNNTPLLVTWYYWISRRTELNLCHNLKNGDKKCDAFLQVIF